MSSFYFDINVDLAQIKRMQQILTQDEKYKNAARKALNRGLSTARTQGNREVKKRYAITTANLNKYSNVKLNKAVISGDEIAGEIYFSGQKIPLYRFTTNPKKRTYTSRFVNGISGWRVNKQVSFGDIKGHMQAGNAAFIATMNSGHTSLWRRADLSKTPSRLIEYYGMSIADMLDYEDARQSIIDKTRDTVEKRLDHEISAVLNGGY